MKVTKSKSFEVVYNGCSVEISKPSETYAYFVKGRDLESSEGGYKTAEEALVSAKRLIDEVE